MDVKMNILVTIDGQQYEGENLPLKLVNPLSNEAPKGQSGVEGGITTPKTNGLGMPTWMTSKVTVTEDTNNYNIKKPYDRSEKGEEEWSEIMNWVRSLGGKWISAGKDSHWTIPKKA